MDNLKDKLQLCKENLNEAMKLLSLTVKEVKTCKYCIKHNTDNCYFKSWACNELSCNSFKWQHQDRYEKLIDEASNEN